MAFASFLEQRLLALEARYGKALQGLESEKEQLQQLVERQSQTVSELQAEVGSSMHNSTLMQRQQATLMDTVQQLLAMATNCKGESVWMEYVYNHIITSSVNKYLFYTRNLQCAQWGPAHFRGLCGDPAIWSDRQRCIRHTPPQFHPNCQGSSSPPKVIDLFPQISSNRLWH